MINMFLLTALVLIEALQVLIITALVTSFIPFKFTEFYYTLFLTHQRSIKPERELLIYHISIIAAIVFQCMVVFFFKNRLEDKELRGKIISLIAVDGCWVLLQLFAVFKIFVQGDSGWARGLLYIVLGLSICSRIFWPEVNRWGSWVYQQVICKSAPALWRKVFAVGVFGIIAVVLLPDVDKALARIFIYDGFNHFDQSLMMPGWAYLNGVVAQVDPVNFMTMGLAAVLSRCALILGGFDYIHMLTAMVFFTIIYYIACFGLLMRWLNNALLAAIGVLLAIKLEMFNGGLFPLAWIAPLSTALHHGVDMIVLLFIWEHSKQLRPRFLYLAACGCGLALGLAMDAGFWLTVAFEIYVVLLICHARTRQAMFSSLKGVRMVCVCAVLPWVIAGGVYYFLFGQIALTASFWSHLTEALSLLSHGFSGITVDRFVEEKQFFAFAFVMGFAIPIVEVLTVIVVGGLCFLNQIQWPNIFVVIVAIYGLGSLTGYMHTSIVGGYYMGGALPLVMILCFWVDKVLAKLQHQVKKNILLIGLVVSLGALLTNNLFVHYPNVLNLAQDKWQVEQEAYHQIFPLTKDVDLIKRLVAPEDSVALISSFETRLLVASQRKPFFNDVPLVNSRHFKAPEFGGTTLYTQERINKAMRQLETAKPSYFFIERKLYLGAIPQEYYQYYQTLSVIVQYAHQHYEEVAGGEYLIALHRITP